MTWVTFTHLSLGFYICKVGMTSASWGIWGSQRKQSLLKCTCVYVYVYTRTPQAHLKSYRDAIQLVTGLKHYANS